MATKQKQSQRQRTSRRSKGTSIGSRKNPQDELTLIIQGKGKFRTFKI
jgi:hypothetical protein